MKFGIPPVSLRTSVLCLGATGVFSLALLNDIRQPNTTPTARGRALAEKLGCFGCHGPEGLGGMRNPDSVEGEIPPLRAEGAFMFFVHDDEEIREWILDGRPERLRETTRGGVVSMPAYRKYVSPVEIDDLVAFVKSVSHTTLPGDPLALEGYEIANELGCFACHGVHGRSSLPNPGSFKGIIPPWDSADYEELVADPSELREWILDGHIERFEKNPLASYFTHRQVIQMPRYRGRIDEHELEALVTYVDWCRSASENELPASDYHPRASNVPSLTERGEFLYHRAGCATCHGAQAEGGIPNPNATGSYVPSLNLTAERLQLFEPEEVEAVIAVLSNSSDPSDHDEQAEREGLAALAYPDDFITAFEELRDLILNGDLPTKRDPDERTPPMRMPAWDERMHADHGPASKADVHAIIAYLLTLQEFE